VSTKHRTHRNGAVHLKTRDLDPGDGPFAVLAHCRVLGVSLHQTAAAAEASNALIDSTAHGGTCSRQHEIVELVLRPKGD